MIIIIPKIDSLVKIDMKIIKTIQQKLKQFLTFSNLKRKKSNLISSKRYKAIQAAGKLSGPPDLSINHDDYLDEIYSETT